MYVYNASFYSTYEELKPIILEYWELYPICFYSTYEELKPSYLPAFSFTTLKFLQYLWGIETLTTHSVYKSFTSFYSTYEELKQAFW